MREIDLKGSAIPEIYYDIIARILPGALILGTYCGWEDLDLSKVGVGLIFSYLVGLILDTLESPYSRFWLSVWRKFSKKRHQRKTNDELWQWLRGLPLTDRTLYTKMMAEKILFSSLSIGTLLMLIFPPRECARICSTLSIRTLFSYIVPPADCHVYIGRWWFAVAFAIFVWCMSGINKSLSSNMSLYRSRTDRDE